MRWDANPINNGPNHFSLTRASGDSASNLACFTQKHFKAAVHARNRAATGHDRRWQFTDYYSLWIFYRRRARVECIIDASLLWGAELHGAIGDDVVDQRVGSGSDVDHHRGTSRIGNC